MPAGNIDARACVLCVCARASFRLTRARTPQEGATWNGSALWPDPSDAAAVPASCGDGHGGRFDVPSLLRELFGTKVRGKNLARHFSRAKALV